MKKLVMAVVAAACMFSASAIGLGVRGDLDIGMGTLGTTEQGKTDVKVEKAKTVTSGSLGAWFDLPFVNLGIASVGIRPECNIAFNKDEVDLGKLFNGEASEAITVKKTEMMIPLYVSASVNLLIVRISGGVGPYVSMPISFSDMKDVKVPVANASIKTPETGWESRVWGIAGYAQGGVRIGPGFLVADVRLSTPLTKDDLFTVVLDTEEAATVAKQKSYKIGVGLGYELKFF